MKILLFAVLCALAGTSGWIGFELRAIRKIHQARWDYERARFITSRDDDLSESEINAIMKAALSHPYELPHTIRKSSAEEPNGVACQYGQQKYMHI